MAAKRVQTTKNYRLFSRSNFNRETNLARHKKLIASLKKYGFLWCFPIVCRRDENKRLVIVDGQHRFQIAESLGLPIHWVESDSDFDIAEINTTAKTWVPADFARMHAENGVESYIEGLEFSESYGIPIGMAFALLGGTTSFNNIRDAFFEGRFEVRDREYANAVADVYVPMVYIASEIKNQSFLSACMRVCRVAEFDKNRLLQNARRCREKLVSYSNTDAYMDMLEDVYNYGRRQAFGLKAATTMAMRDRTPSGLLPGGGRRTA